MRILFLGNSFTHVNHLPAMLSRMTGWETAMVTRGAAFLHDFLNEQDELHGRFLAALDNGPWDYVVLQEQSFNAAGNPEDYLRAAEGLCALIREKGGKPVLYATWPYQEGGDKLAATGMTFAQMGQKLWDTYALASERLHMPAAKVGRAFERAAARFPLYQPDAFHPSPQGTYLAACVFAALLAPDAPLTSWKPDEIPEEEAAGLRAVAFEGGK